MPGKEEALELVNCGTVEIVRNLKKELGTHSHLKKLSI